MNAPASSGSTGRGAAWLRRAPSRAGMTVVEVLIAFSLALLLCAGIIGVGLKGQRFAEHSRLATEASLLAKERLEEIIASGAENVRNPSSLLLNADTNLSSRGYPIVRRPQVFWHSAGGGPADAATGVYAEVYVDVVYDSIHSDRIMTDTVATVVQ